MGRQRESSLREKTVRTVSQRLNGGADTEIRLQLGPKTAPLNYFLIHDFTKLGYYVKKVTDIDDNSKPKSYLVVKLQS